MPLLTFNKQENKPLGLHFNVTEFRCPCTHCSTVLVDSDLIDHLERLRGLIGLPIKITSGYRCNAYQADLKTRGYETATGVSQHELGRAADIQCGGKSGENLALYAETAGFETIGIGKHFIHVDLRSAHADGSLRTWTYTY